MTGVGKLQFLSALHVEPIRCEAADGDLAGLCLPVFFPFLTVRAQVCLRRMAPRVMTAGSAVLGYSNNALQPMTIAV